MIRIDPVAGMAVLWLIAGAFIVAPGIHGICLLLADTATFRSLRDLAVRAAADLRGWDRLEPVVAHTPARAAWIGPDDLAAARARTHDVEPTLTVERPLIRKPAA